MQIRRSVEFRKMTINQVPGAPSAMLLYRPLGRLAIIAAILAGMSGTWPAVAARAQVAAPAQNVASSSVTLPGNHPVEAAAAYAVAHANAITQLDMHVTLGLRNQEQLNQLLQDQQNPSSPRYHQWLTPRQFTARFGPAQQDVDAVEQWLSAQGFKVTASSLADRYVRFGATAADAERAFGTDIMLFGDGSAYANISDPVIPARFKGVIVGIGGMDNFRHSIAGVRQVTSPPASATVSDSSLPLSNGLRLLQSPDVIADGMGPAFGPTDVYSFYDQTSPLSGGPTGAGDCQAIVGDSDYTASAVELFNSTFGLPTSNITTVLADGTNPGIGADELETLVDLEWSHSIAPGPDTRYYLGDDNNNVNGAIVDAIQSAVDEKLCGVISVSFGLCGASAGFYTSVVSPIYAQAASQGQSIFISSGDEGAAGLVLNAEMTACVPGTTRNVNELGSDPNVTQVGGTFFTPNYNSDGDNVGNVAETAWNAVYSGTQDATGGGQSAVYLKPSYQKGLGVPDDGVRDVPDVALVAALSGPAGDGLGLFAATEAGIQCCVIGTSLSVQMWGGIAKLIAQLNHGWLGPINPRLYELANAGEAAAGLRDTTMGNNTYGSVIGFNAGPGFDLTTGWGTADVNTFITKFVGSATPTPTTTPVGPTPTSVVTPTPAITPTPKPTSTVAPVPSGSGSSSSGGGITTWLVFFGLLLTWSLTHLLKNAWLTREESISRED
jgi:subtilase family serine protease